MIIINVAVANVQVIRNFVFKTQKRLKSKKLAHQLHSGMKIHAVRENTETMIISFGYQMMSEFLNRIVAFLVAVPLLIFVGFTPWLLLPMGIYYLNDTLSYLLLFLLKKGLRKEGYKGKVKRITNSEFIKRGVYNGTA